MRRVHRPPSDKADVSAALGAMNADELRAFIVEAFASLDDGPRGQLEDALLRQASRGAAGWRPTAPPSGLRDEVKAFVQAARLVHSADPGQVDDYLRQGVKASLAAQHESARAI